MKKKIILFFCFLAISLSLGILFTYLYMNFINGVLYFNSFIIVFLSSLISLFLWRSIYKEKFESFLVFCVYFFVSLIFVFLGPVTIDRSLSSFIYFYAVENGKVTTNINNKEYFDYFVQRRFVDSEKIGFLKCQKGICYPTVRAKILYYSLSPFGRATKTLVEYDKFKETFLKLEENNDSNK